MPEAVELKTDKPIPAYPRWAVGLSLAMFLVGCLLAALSMAVRDISQDKLGFIVGAAVFIPLGAMGLGMGYTARVQEALMRRIEALEQQLRNNRATEPGGPADGRGR